LFRSTNPAVLYVAAVPASFGKGKSFGKRPSWRACSDSLTASSSKDASGAPAHAMLPLATPALTSTPAIRGQRRFDLRWIMAPPPPLPREPEGTTFRRGAGSLASESGESFLSNGSVG